MNNKIKEKMTIGKAKKILRGFLSKDCYYDTPLYYAIPYLLDYITNLQKENERLKTKTKEQSLLLIDYQDMEQKLEDYKSRIEKAVEYIENNEVCCLEYIGRNGITGNLEKQIQRDLVNRTDLLNILNGKE